MQNEGRKILHLPEMKVSCTCARVPVIRSHSVSVVLRTKEKISVKRAKELIANAPGCKLVDDLKNKVYPMPLDTSAVSYTHLDVYKRQRHARCQPARDAAFARRA